ncbi:MAG: TlpA disulfide reductase family protein [Verrucomicrobiota bacterium]
MKKASIITAIALLFSGASFAQEAASIASGFDKQKIEAVQKYIEENPEAEDLDMAYNIVADAMMAVGDLDGVPAVLEKRYALQAKGVDAPIRMILGEIVEPHVAISAQTGQKEKSQKFIEQVRGDVKTHPAFGQIDQILDQIAGPLFLPSAGDTMEISFTSTEGKDIDLAEMKGKVILVDFWATWCGPCVQEMPNIIAAYDKHKADGFEVIGISLDDSKDKLDAFVSENGMTWPQYFDGKGWQNELVQRFGITGIPATFLIGKDGKVVASNLRGAELEAAIEKALK